jgi:hypothetical protein
VACVTTIVGLEFAGVLACRLVLYVRFGRSSIALHTYMHTWHFVYVYASPSLPFQCCVELI